MFVTSPYRPNHLQLKFYTIMQDSKRVLGFNCKKRIEQLNFFFFFSKHIRVNENLFVWALTGIVYSNLLYRLPTSRLILAFGVQNL